MKRPLAWYTAALVWIAALFGVLQLQNLRNESFGRHGVCGPWGCGPPVSVLVACHAFWLVVILPPAILAARSLPMRLVRRLGIGLASFGLCGLVAIAGWEAATWLPLASRSQRQYVLQRYLFAIVTNVDAPILQTLLIGTGLWIVSRRDYCASVAQKCQSIGILVEVTKT